MSKNTDDDAADVSRLLPFFELEDPSRPECQHYVAGFKNNTGSRKGAVVTLPRDMVELVVLRESYIRPSIEADGIVRPILPFNSAKFWEELAGIDSLDQVALDDLIAERVDMNTFEPNDGEGGVLAGFLTLRDKLKSALDIVEMEILRRETLGAKPGQLN